MGNTYTLRVDNGGVIDGEVRVHSHKLIADNCSCRGDPRVVPIGLAKVLKFVSWM